MSKTIEQIILEYASMSIHVDKQTTRARTDKALTAIEAIMNEVIGGVDPDWRSKMCPYCYEDEEAGLTPFKAGWQERGIEQRQRLKTALYGKGEK